MGAEWPDGCLHSATMFIGQAWRVLANIMPSRIFSFHCLSRTGVAFTQAVSRIVLGTGQLGNTRKGMTRLCPLGAYGLLEDRRGAMNNSEFMGALDLGGRIKPSCNILSSLHIKTFYKGDGELARKLTPMILALRRLR